MKDVIKRIRATFFAKKLLHHGHDSVLRAIRSLGTVGGKHAAARLCEFLADRHPRNETDVIECCTAVTTLARMGQKESLPCLLDCLKAWRFTDDSRLMIALAEALSVLKTPEARQVIVNVLDVTRPWATALADTLSDLGASKWRNWIKGDIEDIRRMATSKDVDAHKVLINTLRGIKQKSGKLPSGVKQNLANCDLELLERLTDAIDDQDSTGLALIAEIGDQRIATRLAGSLGKSSYEHSIRIAEALEKIGEPVWIEELRKYEQYTPDSVVVAGRDIERARAFAACLKHLIKRGQTGAVEPLLNMLARPLKFPPSEKRNYPADSPIAREQVNAIADAAAAAEVLGEIREKRALPILLTAFQPEEKQCETYWGAWAEIAMALAQIGGEQARELLDRVYRTTNSEGLYRAAATALALPETRTFPRYEGEPYC